METACGLKNLEDFEKAVMWKTAGSPGDAQGTRLGLEAAVGKAFAGVYSKSASGLSPKRQDCGRGALHSVPGKSGKTAMPAVWKAAGTGCLDLPCRKKPTVPERAALDWSVRG